MKFYLQKLTYVGDICNLIGYSSNFQLVNGIQENYVLLSRLKLLSRNLAGLWGVTVEF